MTAEERDFPYRDGHRFIDPETGAELDADGPAARAEFLASFEAAQKDRRDSLNALGVRCLQQYLDQPLIGSLRQLCGENP